jgi:predicted PurR-regulated permease PerM
VLQRSAPTSSKPRRPVTYRSGQLSVHKPKPLSNLLVAVDHLSKLCIVVIGIVVAVYALRDWSGFLIPLSAGVVAGLMLSPADARLQEHGLPQWASALVVLITIAVVIYLGASLLWSPIVAGMAQLPELGQALERKVHSFQNSLSHLSNIDNAIKEVADGDEPATVVEMKKATMASNLMSVAPPALGQVLLFAGTMAFFLVGRLRMRQALLRLCFSRAARLRAARIMRDIEVNTSRYLLTIFLINAALGIAVGTAMWLLGLENAIMWGAAAALLNFIPYIGPSIMVVMLLAVGLLAEAPTIVLLTPPAVYLALNLIEFQFITPAALGRSLTLAPFAVFLSISFWLWLWGPVGAFLAVPLLLIFVITIKHLLPE